MSAVEASTKTVPESTNFAVSAFDFHGASSFSVQPSAADYLACNRAMKRRFGIAIDLPAEQQGGRKMSDREAIDRKLRQPD